MAVDVTGIAYFLPVISFVLVFFIVFAVLKKLELFDDLWPTAIIAFFIATVFITVGGSIEFIRYITGWMAILFVSMIFILAIIGFFGKDLSGATRGFGYAFLIIAIIIFLISGLVVYSNYISPFLPGGDNVGGNTPAGAFAGWLYSSKVLGAILLLIVGGIAAWLLSRK